MDPAIEQQDFDPPRERRLLLRGLPVAIVANVLLVLALAASLDWKRAPDPASAAIPLPPPSQVPPSVSDTAVMGAGAPAERPSQAPPRESGKPAPSRQR